VKSGTTNTMTITITKSQVPVMGEFDVLVAGGGMTGIGIYPSGGSVF
jgi:hypothetical protein